MNPKKRAREELENTVTQPPQKKLKTTTNNVELNRNAPGNTSNSQSKQKKSIILLGTRKIYKKADDENKADLIDIFSPNTNFQPRQYPQNSWVGFIVVNTKEALTHHLHKNKDNEKLVNFLNSYFEGKIDKTAAYFIEEYNEFAASFTITHTNRQGKKLFDTKQETKLTLETIISTETRLQELKAAYAVEIFGLIIPSQTILSLMLHGIKKYEYRPSSYTNHIPTTAQDHVTSSHHGPHKQTKSNKTAPTRSDIKKKKRQPKKPFPPRQLNTILNRYNIKNPNLHQQIMYDFTYEKIEEIFKLWIFQKDMETKNENNTIKKHNETVMLWFYKALKAFDHWQKTPVCKDKNGKYTKNYELLQNFVAILFGIPQSLNYLISQLETCYIHLKAVLYTILGFADYHCIYCSKGKVTMKYNPNFHPHYEFRCLRRKCGKKYNFRQSMPPDHPFRDKMKRTSLSEILYVWKDIIEYTLAKQGLCTRNYSTDKRRKIKTDLYKTLIINNQHNHVVLGSSNKHCYVDHTFKGVNRKYGRGYLKAGKGLWLAACDDSGIFLFAPATSERKIETNWLIEKYTEPDVFIDTDYGKAFGDIPELGDRTHRKVNHSGEYCSDGLLHYFKNIDTGGCINSVEGWNGRLSQLGILKDLQFSSDAEKLEGTIALMDIRYNRSNNHTPQVIINFLVAYSNVYPLKAEALKKIEQKDFTNMYGVEEILDKRKSTRRENAFEYLLNWKDFALYRASWHHANNLNNKSLIEQYDRLPKKDKMERRKRYEKAVERRTKTDIDKNCVALLTLDKVDKFVRSHIKKNAMECILQDKILIIEQKSLDKQDGETYIKLTGSIAGGTSEEEKIYELNIVFHDGTPTTWECECDYFINVHNARKPLMCKHLYAAILEVSTQGQKQILKHKLR